jgi:hypothetical protein
VRTPDRRATAPTGIRRFRAALTGSADRTDPLRGVDQVGGGDPGEPVLPPHSRPRPVPPPLV